MTRAKKIIKAIPKFIVNATDKALEIGKAILVVIVAVSIVTGLMMLAGWMVR
jgi:hypothetical protein